MFYLTLIKVVCFVLNALHWAFLTYQVTPSLLVVTIIVATITLYIIIPVILLSCIQIFSENNIVSKSIHMAEIIYHSFIDFGTIFISMFGWCVLSRCAIAVLI
jgi:hypothetical protein